MSSGPPPTCGAAARQEIHGVALTSTELRVWLRDIGVTEVGRALAPLIATSSAGLGFGRPVTF